MTRGNKGPLSSHFSWGRAATIMYPKVAEGDIFRMTSLSAEVSVNHLVCN